MAVVYRAKVGMNTVEVHTECPSVYVMRIQHTGDTDTYLNLEEVLETITEIEQDYRDFGLPLKVFIDKLRPKEKK